MTGFRDFVFEGYRVQAVDYLVKPVDADRLSSVLSRVRRQLEQVRQKQFVFQNGDGVYRLYQDEIQYFYSEKRKVVAVTREKELSFYAKLNEVEARVGRTFDCGVFQGVSDNLLNLYCFGSQLYDRTIFCGTPTVVLEASALWMQLAPELYAVFNRGSGEPPSDGADICGGNPARM